MLGGKELLCEVNNFISKYAFNISFQDQVHIFTDWWKWIMFVKYVSVTENAISGKEEILSLHLKKKNRKFCEKHLVPIYLVIQ